MKSQSGIEPGAVVTCKLDGRDVSHAHGIVGVVTKANEMGAVQVMCKHDVLSAKGFVTWWIPSDKYKVIAQRDEVANISNELTNIRGQITQGTFVMEEE